MAHHRLAADRPCHAPRSRRECCLRCSQAESAALAITGRVAGSDVANLRTKARRDSNHYMVGEEHYHLGMRRPSDRSCARRRAGQRRPAPDQRHAGPVADEAEEDGLVGVGRRDASLRRLPGPQDLISEEGLGFRMRSLRVRTAAHGHGGGLHGLCPRLPRGGDRLRQGAYETFGEPIAQHQVIRQSWWTWRRRSLHRRHAGNAGVANQQGRSQSPRST